MNWIKSFLSGLQFKDYVFTIYVIGSLFFILSIKDCLSGIGGGKETVEVPSKPVFSNKEDRNWNECIFNSLEVVNPEAINKCDTKYSQIKVKGK